MTIRNFSLACALIVAFAIAPLAFSADKPAAPKAAKPPAPKPTLSGLNPTTLPPAGTPDNTPPAGFTAMFNGKDLTGWKGLLKSPLDSVAKRALLSAEERTKAQEEADKDMAEHWKAVDGVLVYDGKGRNLCSAKDYGDFEMWVDWKIEPKGDSGIYLRGSPQVQIWDPANKRFPRAVFGSGALYNNETNPNDPLVLADNPIGQWNTFFIHMVGEKVTVYLNGKLVTDNVTLENYWEKREKRDVPIYATGTIELQNHHDQLWFKNIYVKELAGAQGK